MHVGRVLASCAAVLAVGGFTTLAVGMGRAATTPDAGPSAFSMPSSTEAPDPTTAVWTPYHPPSTAPSTRARPATGPATRPAATVRPARTATAVRPHARSAGHRSRPAPVVGPKVTAKPTAVRGQSLPVGGSTGSATRILTVTASSSRSTTATLQPWDKAPGGGWLKHGSPIPAHVGADGLSSAASEARSATPIGSFTLTQAFGAYADPGTALPYFQTNSADWWISQAGPLYNTHQHCASGCGFTHGAPNEHLAYELPYYRYAVVIDYNTRNAPGGVRAGRGSAFFLHVTDGRATAGCVAIAQSRLTPVMRWLTPATHPRILIGVA
jgi:L,D-peptidoglycan transpeptidase YkuD (ErfK/YbiS/YcfS/YnhG family)